MRGGMAVFILGVVVVVTVFILVLVVVTVFILGRYLPDNSTQAVNLSRGVVLASPSQSSVFIAQQIHKVNFVLQSGGFQSGVSYRVRFSATDASTDTVATSEIELTMNAVPENGTLSVEPSTGVALNTSFAIAAPGWSDEHLPLSYLFAVQLGVETLLLTDWTNMSSLRTLLPQCTSTAALTNTSCRIVARISDNFNAVEEQSVGVSVEAYHKPANTTWAQNIERMINQSTSTDSAQTSSSTAMLTSMAITMNYAVASAGAGTHHGRRRLLQDDMQAARDTMSASLLEDESGVVTVR